MQFHRDASIYKRSGAVHLNTVLALVSWEQIEPREGQFDITFLDVLVDNARQIPVHLVWLWFGTCKNMVSSYALAWARSDGTGFRWN